MRFFDTISLGQAAEVASTRVTRNGALVVNARVARGGNVQDYLGAEVGKPDRALVRVYRDADEIFAKDSLATFPHKAVTLDHPAQPVTARSWRDVARGHTGDEVLRDGEFVRIPMLIADQAAIDAVQGGKREISVGYQCDLDWTPGKTPSGEAYDARQIKITVDHVAIVDRGRAGPDCRIGDQRPAEADKTMRALDHIHQKETAPMRTHLVDGHSVEMSDAAIVAVTALQGRVGTLTTDNLALTTKLGDAERTHAAAITAKDAEITTARRAVETKDGEIAALKKQVEDATLTPAKLDAAVAARAVVVGAAKTLLGDAFKADGKSEAEIRREAVTARLGDAAKTMSDDAVIGAFAALTKDAAAADPIRSAFAGGLQTNDASPEARAQAAWAKNVKDRQEAWKGAA